MPLLLNGVPAARSMRDFDGLDVIDGVAGKPALVVPAKALDRKPLVDLDRRRLVEDRDLCRRTYDLCYGQWRSTPEGSLPYDPMDDWDGHPAYDAYMDARGDYEDAVAALEAYDGKQKDAAAYVEGEG